MRRFACFLLAVLMVLLACSVVATAEQVPAWQTKPITIRFLNRWAEGVDALYGPITSAIKEFTTKYPNVTVEYDAVAGADDVQFYEKMRTAAATGNMYEIFQNYGGSTIRSYVDSGLLLDLTDEFKADPAWRDSFMDVFSMWQFDGMEGVYGVPFTYFATVLYCNTDLFKQYNLQIPKTISEFESVCDAFVKAGVTPIPRSGEGWRWAHWATGMVMQKYGQQLVYDLANRSKKYTGEEMMSIAQMFLDWQAKGYFGQNIASMDSATEQLLFSTGKSPMIAIGTWQPENIVMNNPDLLDKVEVVWFPYFDEHPELASGNMGGPNEGLCITKKDPDTTAATVALLKHLTSAETVSKMWESAPYTPFAITTAKQPDNMNSLTKRALKLITDEKPVLMQEIDQYDEIAGLQDTLRNAYAGMMAGGTAEEAMKKVQDEIDNYIA